MGPLRMIKESEIMKGQACPKDYAANLQKLLKSLNKFRSAYGKPMIVTSGYRSPEHNRKIGGAKNSAHLSCQAADFSDPDRKLAEFCLNNEALLESCGLWVEHPSYTPTWVHLQIRPVSQRYFKP